MDEYPLWKDILEYARFAPSPHNVQPWKVKIISEKKAELYFVPERLLPVEDPTGCFNSVGYGIFIEMASIAASVHNFEVVEELAGSTLDATKKEPILFATLTLNHIRREEPLQRELIKKRRTSRLRFDGRVVEDPVIQELQEIATSYGYEFGIRTDKEMVDWVLKLNCDTVFYDMEEKGPREEIASWLRYSAQEAEQKRDGLWSYCMRFPGVLMYLFFHHQWLFQLPGIKQFVRHLYLRSTGGTQTVGWLRGPFVTQKEWVKAGRMLARLWLSMTNNGVVLHPFGSIITNHRSHQTLQKKFNITEEKEKVWLLIRMGYSKEPPRSKRLSLSDIISNEL